MNFAKVCACIALGAVAASPSQGATPVSPSTSETLRLSRRQAIAEALERNPALAAARQQVEEARGQLVTATALPDPTLVGDVLLQRNPLNPGSAGGHDIGLGVTLPLPGKIRLRGKVAEANIRVAEFTLAQMRQQVASQAAQDYDAVLVALRHRDDLTQGKALSLDFLQKTKARLLAGTVAKIEVVKAEVDVAQAENDLIANERTIATAYAALNRLLGRMGGAPLEVTDALEVPAAIGDLGQLENLALASRPEIQSLSAQRAGARSATRLAREFWVPDFNLSLTQNSVDGSPSTYTTLVSIGLPLWFWQHTRGEVATAEHREKELAATASDTAAQVSLDVRTASANATTALRQVVFIRDELLPEAREVYRVAAVSYGLGGASALELLDAKRTLLDAQKQFADALGAANDAQAALELAVGAPLPPPPGGSHP